MPRPVDKEKCVLEKKRKVCDREEKKRFSKTMSLLENWFITRKQNKENRFYIKDSFQNLNLNAIKQSDFLFCGNSNKILYYNLLAPEQLLQNDPANNWLISVMHSKGNYLCWTIGINQWICCFFGCISESPNDRGIVMGNFWWL